MGPIVVAPVGRGGVAALCDLVAPFVPEARRMAVGGESPPGSLLRVLASLGGGPVVHVHSSFRHRAVLRDGLLVRAAAARGCPVVWQFHGTSRALASAPAPGLLAALRWAVRRAVLTSVDPWLVDRLEAEGIEVLRSRIAADPGAVVREPEPGLVLFVGRLVPEKGIRELLASVAGWPAGARLVVAGDGPLAAEVARAGPRVTALGWVDAEVRRTWLGRASLVVLPSREEAAPLAVAEAVAAGVPVVAAGGGAVRELVGHAGLCLDRADATSLAAAVTHALATAFPEESDRVRRAVSAELAAEQWRAHWALARARVHG